jgi:hypothetical protein
VIGFLEDIWGVISNIPLYILYVFETGINLIFAGVQLLLEGASEVLPGLPATISPPEWVEAINWFFPLGTVLGIATTLLAGYVLWLGVSWIFRKVGAL